MKKIITIIIILILIILGLYTVRYGQSQKYYSQDGQYSFYSKRSVFGIPLISMPGDGDTSGGTIYVYDEIEKNVIFQFESSWLRADIENSEFSSYNGGKFICKSGQYFNLPRPLKKIVSQTDKKIKSGFNIEIRTDFQTAQKAMHFYKSSHKDRFMYYIKIPDKKLMIATRIIVKKKATGILNITLDSILHYSVRGNTVGYYQEPKKEDIDFAEKLTKIEIEKLFKKQVYQQNKKNIE